jgi:hypothetical protein
MSLLPGESRSYDTTYASARFFRRHPDFGSITTTLSKGSEFTIPDTFLSNCCQTDEIVNVNVVEYQTDDNKPATVNLSIQRSGSVNKTVLTEIITANDVKVQNAEQKIRIKLKKPSNGTNKNWVCKYLKTDTLTWDTLGCTTDKAADQTITCECNHNSIYTAIEEVTTTSEPPIAPEPTPATEEEDDSKSKQTLWLGLWIYVACFFSLIGLLPFFVNRDKKDAMTVNHTMSIDKTLPTMSPKSGGPPLPTRKTATIGNKFDEVV